MRTDNEILNSNIVDLVKQYPFVKTFFENNSLDIKGDELVSPKALINDLSPSALEDLGTSPEELESHLLTFIKNMLAFVGEDKEEIKSITILPGNNKTGGKEAFDEIKISRGEIISIVGPTGSGKSRLLADIEWIAQKDTPTKREILINDKKANTELRFSSSEKLVAQLSQNMNFVMDLTVQEFLELHAESRMIDNKEIIIEKIIKEANILAGEKFNTNTALTSLSGGQSRALMIADTAILSTSPIILIDEIENAGIDRKKALKLLLSEDKIVLMATHDPILALMADKRLVIKNGAVEKLIETTDKERSLLTEMEKMDKKLKNLRSKLRLGEKLYKI